MESFKTVKIYLSVASLSFIGMMALCILLYPQIFKHADYGLSAFGVVTVTRIPFIIGFTLTSVAMVLIGRLLSPCSQQLAKAFWSFGVLLFCIAISSLPSGSVAYYTHWFLVLCLTLCIVATMVSVIRLGGLSLLDHVLLCILSMALVASAVPFIYHLPYIKLFLPRELLVFICSLWLFGRAALRQVKVEEA